MIVLVTLLSATAAASIHRRPVYSQGWTVSPVAVREDERVHVTLCVKEQGREEIRRIASEVSDPESTHYGKYLTVEEIENLTAPTAEHMSTVTDWLSSHSVQYRTRHSNVIADMSVAEAAAVFATKFQRVENYGVSLIRANDYQLPTPIESAVSTVFGLHGLPLPPRGAGMPSMGSRQRLQHANAVANVTPGVLKSTYGISGVVSSRSPKNRQAVVEFQGQLMNATDLATLFETFVKDYEPGVDDSVYKFGGDPDASARQGDGLEALLDIEYIMASAVGIKTEFWEYASDDFCGDLNRWTSNITTSIDVPLVHSVSYGWQGDLNQIHCSSADVGVVDDNFAKLAAKGITIVVASGDSGSGYTKPSACPDGGGQSGLALEGEVMQTSNTTHTDCCVQGGTAIVGQGYPAG